MGHGANVTAAALCRVPRIRPRAVLGILPSVVLQIEEERLFRRYVCDSLQLAPQNKFITKRFSELLTPPKAENTREPQEIVAEIVEKAGLTLK